GRSAASTSRTTSGATASRRIVKPSRSNCAAASVPAAGVRVSGATFTRSRLPLGRRGLRLRPDLDLNGAAALAFLRELYLSGVLVVRERDLGVVGILLGLRDLVAA